MAKLTEIDMQVVEAGQEIPLDTTKTAEKVVSQKTCGNCLWFCREDGEPYYCFKKDLYTFQNETDSACEEWKDGN